MARMFDNVYLDLSCTMGFDAWNLIDKLRPFRVPWHKLLFGTDSSGDENGALNYVNRWKELMSGEFFAPHAEEFFCGNAVKLLKKAGLQ